MAWFKARHRRRARFTFWRGLRWIGSLSTVILVTGLGLQWLVPEEWVEWQAEVYLSDYLSRPVDLRAAALKMFPLPHVRADGLTVGDAAARILAGEEVRFYLDFMGVLRGNPIRRISLRQAGVSLEHLMALLATHADAGEGRFSRLEVERLGFAPGREMAANAPALLLTGFADGSWSGQLSRRGQQLSLRAKATGKWLSLAIESPAWILDEQQVFALRDVSAELRVSSDQAVLERLLLSLPKGRLQAAGQVHRQADWRVEGSMTLTGIDAGALLPAFGVPLLDGVADGTLLLDGGAWRLADMADGLRVTGELALRGGRLKGMDLALPASRRDVGEYSGGSTLFDQAVVQLASTQAGRGLTIARMVSSVLQASGEILLAPGERLSGQLRVKVADSDGAEVPLLLSGALDAPVLRVAPEALSSEPPVEDKASVLDNLRNWWGPAGSETPQARLPEDDAGPAQPWVLDYE